MKKFSLAIIVIALIAVAFTTATAQENLKPYFMAYQGEGTIETKLAEVKEALTGKGFEIVGEYSPFAGTHVIAITNDLMKATAAKSQYGGFGSMQRVTLTEVESNIQIAYTNPAYWSNTYRLTSELKEVSAELEAALGKRMEFGSKKGVSVKRLRNFQYMAMMPKFHNVTRLKKYKSHKEALDAVEAGFKTKRGLVRRIYRIDLPGKDESVFGVGIKLGQGEDRVVMAKTDLTPTKHSGYMPYELLVTNGDVFIMHGKFRIAISFPDLSMGTFMKISGAPEGILKSMRAIVAGK
jgi:hypothetical protein